MIAVGIYVYTELEAGVSKELIDAFKARVSLDSGTFEAENSLYYQLGLLGGTTKNC